MTVLPHDSFRRHARVSCHTSSFFNTNRTLALAMINWGCAGLIQIPMLDEEARKGRLMMVTKCRCSVCGRVYAGVLPKGTNGSLMYPRRHRGDGGAACRTPAR